MAAWRFRDFRRLLRQDRGDGFVLPEAVDAMPETHHENLPSVLTRLTELGLLEEEAPGWWRVTNKGRKHRERSEGRFTKGRAVQLLSGLKERIAAVNADSKYVVRFETAVHFGSVLEEREWVGDVEAGAALRRRRRGQESRSRFPRACARVHSRQFHGISLLDVQGSEARDRRKRARQNLSARTKRTGAPISQGAEGAALPAGAFPRGLRRRGVRLRALAAHHHDGDARRARRDLRRLRPSQSLSRRVSARAAPHSPN